jgi:hypothetical protein
MRMDPNNAAEIAAARPSVIDRGLERTPPGVFDLRGVLRGKYLSRGTFLDALEPGASGRSRPSSAGPRRSPGPPSAWPPPPPRARLNPSACP